MLRVGICFMGLAVGVGLAQGRGVDVYDVVRCGTVRWLYSVQQAGISGERPVLPAFYETPDGHFRLHYALAGVDAVPPADADGNGVPDYIDTAASLLSYVYSVLVDTLGYPPPPSDSGAGGSDAYDVYFLNLGPQGLYGETVPERLLPQGSFPRFTSFLKLDNDYSPADSVGGRPTYRETGVRALRVAIAHELYHAVQFGNYGIARSGMLLYELASTFMEWRIFPDTRDYEQFLPELFQQPEQCVFGDGDNAALGYRFAVFGQYLYLRWGDTVFHRMWEHIGAGAHPYGALDTALRECAQSSLPTAWCEFLPWLYYTGRRARPGYFPRAAEFPMVRFAHVATFTPPTAMHSGHLLPFEFRFVRVVFSVESGQTPDTLDLALSNPDLAAVLRSQYQPADYTVVCGYVPDGEPIPGTPYAVRLQGVQGLCRQLFWNAGVSIVAINEAYPQPFVLGVHERFCVPVPPSAALGVAAAVEVYTPAWQRAASFTGTVQLDGSYLVCCIGPVAVRPGVYIYRLVVGGQEQWGKLVVSEQP